MVRAQLRSSSSSRSRSRSSNHYNIHQRGKMLPLETTMDYQDEDDNDNNNNEYYNDGAEDYHGDYDEYEDEAFLLPHDDKDDDDDAAAALVPFIMFIITTVGTTWSRMSRRTTTWLSCGLVLIVLALWVVHYRSNAVFPYHACESAPTFELWTPDQHHTTTNSIQVVEDDDALDEALSIALGTRPKAEQVQVLGSTAHPRMVPKIASRWEPATACLESFHVGHTRVLYYHFVGTGLCYKLSSMESPLLKTDTGILVGPSCRQALCLADTEDSAQKAGHLLIKTQPNVNYWLLLGGPQPGDFLLDITPTECHLDFANPVVSKQWHYKPTDDLCGNAPHVGDLAPDVEISGNVSLTTNKHQDMVTFDSPAAQCYKAFHIGMRQQVVYHRLTGDGKCYHVDTLDSATPVRVGIVTGDPTCKEAVCVASSGSTQHEQLLPSHVRTHSLHSADYHAKTAKTSNNNNKVVVDDDAAQEEDVDNADDDLVTFFWRTKKGVSYWMAVAALNPTAETNVTGDFTVHLTRQRCRFWQHQRKQQEVVGDDDDEYYYYPNSTTTTLRRNQADHDAEENFAVSRQQDHNDDDNNLRVLPEEEDDKAA